MDALRQVKMCFSFFLFRVLFPLEYVSISLMQLREKRNFKQKIYARVYQKKITISSKEYVT